MRIGGYGRFLGMLLGLGLTVGGARLFAQDFGDDPTTDAAPANFATEDLAGEESAVDAMPADATAPADDAMPKSRSKAKSKTKTKARRPTAKKTPGRGASKASGDDMRAPTAAAPAAPPAKADDGTITFSRDIAPILVGNCIGCHNPKDKDKRKDFDLSTFAGLMKGGADGPAISPGNPDETLLLLRVKGEETPKMPPGQRNLGPEAIAKIEQWVKAGALLDQGIDPSAELAKVAPTPDMLRRETLAKMSPDELDAAAKAVALERWKKASSKTTPEMSSDKHFIVFGNIPQDRAKALLKVLEAQYMPIGRLLGPLADKTPLTTPEKISVYVFNDSNAYIEFVRGFENRETDSAVESHANFGVDTPYIAAADPLHGGEEAVAKTPAKKAARGKRAAADDEPAGPDRTLAGLVSESLGAGVITSAGQPPRWLSLGFGAYLGAQVEPRSPYYRALRSEAYTAFEQGRSKVREAIGGEGENMRIRAVGFSLVECLATTEKARFPIFIREMISDGQKFDEAAQGIFGASPDEFLDYWGGFVSRYGRGR